jgi:hypothetical protein
MPGSFAIARDVKSDAPSAGIDTVPIGTRKLSSLASLLLRLKECRSAWSFIKGTSVIVVTVILMVALVVFLPVALFNAFRHSQDSLPFVSALGPSGADN